MTAVCKVSLTEYCMFHLLIFPPVFCNYKKAIILAVPGYNLCDTCSHILASWLSYLVICSETTIRFTYLCYRSWWIFLMSMLYFFSEYMGYFKLNIYYAFCFYVLTDLIKWLVDHVAAKSQLWFGKAMGLITYNLCGLPCYSSSLCKTCKKFTKQMIKLSSNVIQSVFF